MQSTIQENNEAAIWNQLAPLLDEAVSRLGKKDRDAVMLRFFKDKSVREVAAALKVNEAAAQRRLLRAVDKLRRFFTKRGVALSGMAIAGAISANSVQAAPMTLAKTVTVITVAKGAAASGSTLTLIKGALKIMAWTKMKMAVAVVGVLLIGGATTVTFQTIQKHHARAWRTENINTNIANVLKDMPAMVEILPTQYPQAKGWGYEGGVLDQKMAGVNRSLKDLLYEADTDLPTDRLIFPNDLPTNKYDYVVNYPTNSRPALQEEIKKQFGWILKNEMLETNVLLLSVAQKAPGLKLHQGPPNHRGWQLPNGTPIFSGDDITMANLAKFLEMYVAVPVVDLTGLTNHFDIRLKLNMDQFSMEWKDHHLEDFQPALLEQLGLELVPTNMPIEMLIVEKVK